MPGTWYLVVKTLLPKTRSLGLYIRAQQHTQVLTRRIENRAQPSPGLMISEHLRITRWNFQPLNPACMVMLCEHRNECTYTRAAHIWTRTGMFYSSTSFGQ